MKIATLLRRSYSSWRSLDRARGRRGGGRGSHCHCDEEVELPAGQYSSQDKSRMCFMAAFLNDCTVCSVHRHTGHLSSTTWVPVQVKQLVSRKLETLSYSVSSVGHLRDSYRRRQSSIVTTSARTEHTHVEEEEEFWYSVITKRCGVLNLLSQYMISNYLFYINNVLCIMHVYEEWESKD